MKKFLKLILKLILKTDWDSFWSSLFFYTMCATIVFVFVLGFLMTKNIITKPKCDTNKRVEFIEKCQSRGGGVFACGDLSMDLYCTK